MTSDGDAKKGGGYLKEKLIIGLTRFTSDEVERAIMKVTSHMLKAPNEKHMERLVQATHGQYNSGSVDHGDVNRYILEEFEKRTHTHNWIVVLKTFVALHRLMGEGSIAMQRTMGQRLGIFCGRNIKDLADCPDGAMAKSFIEQYIRYLEERSISQHKLLDEGITERIENHQGLLTALTNKSIEDLLHPFELLVSMMELLAAVEFRPAIVDNFLMLEAYRMLVVDGKRLYHILTNRVMFMLEVFEEQPLSLKNKWLKAYTRFDNAVKRLGRLFDQMNSSTLHWGEVIPSLKLLPESILHKLEDDIKYSDVKTEDLSALLGGVSVASEDRGPRVRSLSPPQPQPTAAAATDSPTNSSAETAERAKTGPTTALTTSKAKEDPELPPPVQNPKPATKNIDDLFGGEVAPKSTVAPARVSPSAISPTSQKVTTDDLFGPSSSSVVVGMGSTTTTSSRATAPPPATAADEGFDPFGSAAPQGTSSAARSTAGPGQQPNGVDFFFSTATPQQQYATTNTTHVSGGRGGSPAAQGVDPFSDLASQSRHRAW